MESHPVRKPQLSFHMLRVRLVAVVNSRIQNGDFTERGLARLLGISQPQIHNVLKGARKLQPELADRLISTLKITVLDLLATEELHNELFARAGDAEFADGISGAAGPQPKDVAQPAPRKPAERATLPHHERDEFAS